MSPDERQAIIDEIHRFQQHGDSVAEIAAKLHLPETTVQHVVAHGEPPEAQPQWPID
ncbi:MAG: helix-turn-helix domain-containing protein [Planctomycetaceae bacterium]|nr:helix-turn-helix domain-containing protein [Planctomycetaceae bacterium]